MILHADANKAKKSILFYTNALITAMLNAEMQSFSCLFACVINIDFAIQYVQLIVDV
jgi:hypothetical protein